ncbi:neuronal acetylcholine receptor subunit alpha-7-like [Vespula squamosa]|uniref:Neuronal acetylcholine receptor subunit alpha-7-like n=1 Tax=Vespula squamosa TaxID=30214 RepID=A0ABD1ZWT3_VESSQ
MKLLLRDLYFRGYKEYGVKRRKGPGVTESIKVLTVNVNWAGLVSGGSHEKRLLSNLLDSYNVLERPVGNESDPLVLSFGLTLMQIIDVASRRNDHATLTKAINSFVAVFNVSLLRCESRIERRACTEVEVELFSVFKIVGDKSIIRRDLFRER